MFIAFLLTLTTSFAQQFANHHEDYVVPFEHSADSIIALGNIVSVEAIKASLEKGIRPVQMQRIKKNRNKLDEVKLYEYAKKATVLVGNAYLCPRCEHTHVGSSSGYAIAESGIVITNYHVVKGYVEPGEGNKPLAFLVRFFDGKTYAVKDILSASEKEDLAVLQLETNGRKVPALPLSEGAPIGEDAYVLGHPKGMYYYFTKGMVNAKYVDAYDNQDGKRIERDVMAISADYAAGSSGGPVLDGRGNIIGTVSSTRTLTYSDRNRSVQMVLKLTIPVESLHRVLSLSKG